LRSHAHALAIDGVEAAYCVAERQQPAGEFIEPVEMPPHARGKPEAGDLPLALGALDRIVDGGRAQLLRIGEKTVPIAGRLDVVAPHEGDDPAVPFSGNTRPARPPRAGESNVIMAVQSARGSSGMTKTPVA